MGRKITTAAGILAAFFLSTFAGAAESDPYPDGERFACVAPDGQTINIDLAAALAACIARADAAPGVPVDVVERYYRVVTAPAPIDCAGTWSSPARVPGSESSCIDGSRTYQTRRDFTITTPPANGGQACPQSPELTTESEPCAVALPPTASPDITVAAGGRYFRLDGRPFSWVADTGWLQVANTDDAGITEYLEDRAGRGVRVVQGPILIGGTELALPPGDPAFPAIITPGQPVRLNEAYFSRVDHAVREAGRLGISLFIAPIWGRAPDLVFPNAADHVEYQRLIARRYAQQAHVNYIPSGEYTKIAYENAADGSVVIVNRPLTAAEKARFRAVAEAIRAEAPGALIAWHPDGCKRPSPDLDPATPADFWMLQGGSNVGCTIRDVPLERSAVPTRPVVEAELHYEGANDTPEQIRRGAWNAYLLGAAGFTYGHGKIWDFEPTWRDYLGAPGALNTFGPFASVVRRIHRETNLPAQSLIVDPGTFADPVTHVAGLRSADFRVLWAYTGNGRSYQVRTDQLAAGAIEARHIDPRTGTAGAWFGMARAGAVTVDPPGSPAIGNDWITEIQSVQSGATAGVLSIQITPPTENEDGSPISPPLTYQVAYRPASGGGAEVIAGATLSGSVLSVLGVPAGQYLARARAQDAVGDVSDWSLEARADVAGGGGPAPIVADTFEGATGPVDGRIPDVAPAGQVWRYRPTRTGGATPAGGIVVRDGSLVVETSAPSTLAEITISRQDSDIRFTWNTGPVAGARLFVAVRRASSADFLWWNLRQNNADVIGYRVTADVQSTIAPSVPFAFALNRAYAVRIVTSGGTSTISIDGVTVSSMPVPANAAGVSVGLGAAGLLAPVRYDDVLIY